MIQAQSVGGGIAALRKALGAYKGIPPQQIRATVRGAKAMKTLASKQVRGLDPVQGEPDQAAAPALQGLRCTRRAIRSRRSSAAPGCARRAPGEPAGRGRRQAVADVGRYWQ